MDWGDTSSFSIIYCNCFTVLVGIALIALPFYILFYYFRNVHTLDDEEFQERFGTLLDDLKIESNENEETKDLIFKRKISVLFPFFFVVRRLIFVGISIGLAPWPYFQLMGAFFLTTGMIIYLLWFWPFADNFFTRIEVMNEITSILMLYVMLVFSDWVPEPLVRYDFGWIFIGLFSANVCVHVFFLLRDMFKIWLLKLYKKCKTKKKQAITAPVLNPDVSVRLAVVEEVEDEAEASESEAEASESNSLQQA